MGRELLLNPEQGPAHDTLDSQRQAGPTSASPCPAAVSALPAAQPRKPSRKVGLLSEKLSSDLLKGVHKATPFKMPKHGLQADGETIRAERSAADTLQQEAPHCSDRVIQASTPGGPIRSKWQTGDPAVFDNEAGVPASTPGGPVWRNLQAYDPAVQISGADVSFRAVHTDFSSHAEIPERNGRPDGRWGPDQRTAPADGKELMAAQVQAGRESFSSCRGALLDSCSDFLKRASSPGAPFSKGETDAASFHLPGLAWRQDADARVQQSRGPGAKVAETQIPDSDRLEGAEASREREDENESKIGAPQSPSTSHAPVGALSRLSLQGVLGAGGPHHGSIHRSASPRDQEATLGSTRPEGSCCLWRSSRHDCACLKAAVLPRCASLSPLGPGQTSLVAQVEHSAAALLHDAGTPQRLGRSPEPRPAHGSRGHQGQGHPMHQSRSLLRHVVDASSLETPMSWMGTARGLHHDHGHAGVPHNSHGWPESRRLRLPARHKVVALPEELLLSPAAPLEQHPSAKVVGGFTAMLTVLSSRGKCTVRQKVPFSAVYLAAASSYLYGASLPVSALAKSEPSVQPVPEHMPKMAGDERLKVPCAGQLQLILLNPEGTPIHTYVCPYDLSDMPGRSKTFLRQRYIRQHAAPAEKQPQTDSGQEDSDGNGRCSPAGPEDLQQAGQNTQTVPRTEDKVKAKGARQHLGPGPLEYGLHLRFMCLPASRQSKEQSEHKRRRPRPSLDEPCQPPFSPALVGPSAVGPSSYPSPSSLASSPASSLDCDSPLSNFSPPAPPLVRFSPIGPFSSPLAAAVASEEAPGPGPANPGLCTATPEPALEDSLHDAGEGVDSETKTKCPKSRGSGALRHFLHGELRVCFLLRDSAADPDTKLLVQQHMPCRPKFFPLH